MLLLTFLALLFQNISYLAGTWETLLVLSEIPRSVGEVWLNVANGRRIPRSLSRRADLDSSFPSGSVVYSFAVAPAGDGPLNVSVSARSFKDLANNWNDGNWTSIVVDRVNPNVTLRVFHPPVSNLTSAYFTVAFSEVCRCIALF
jgi:hypothetical protein